MQSPFTKLQQVSPVVGELVRDIRKLMGPYTANNLREKRYAFLVSLLFPVCNIVFKMLYLLYFTTVITA